MLENGGSLRWPAHWPQWGARSPRFERHDWAFTKGPLLVVVLAQFAFRILGPHVLRQLRHGHSPPVRLARVTELTLSAAPAAGAAPQTRSWAVTVAHDKGGLY